MGKKSAGSILVVVLLGVYAFAQPRLNERFGWNLPGLNQNTQSEPVAEPGPGLGDSPIDSLTADGVPPSLGDVPRGGTSHNAAPPKTSAKDNSNNEVESSANPAPARDSDDRVKPTGSTPGKAGNKGPPQTEDAPKSDLLFGLLREVSHDRFLSPQGLQYLPGSAEGHRLEHLRRHINDQPSRPGKHGVFDGGMEGALAIIDKAYERAKKNQRTTKQVDRDRTIYTVDMGRRVGYVGGRDGNRQKKPMARRVKLVLEGTSVITAYPL